MSEGKWRVLMTVDGRNDIRHGSGKGGSVIPSDRVNALLSGHLTDRVPAFLFILGFCARNVGYPISIIYSDPQKSMEAQLWTREMYGYDNDPFYGYASYGTWEFGGHADYPSSELEQAPLVSYYPVKSERDVDSLELPDVGRAGMLPQAMEFSRLQRRLGMPASVVLGGTFTIAGNVCGVERLCRWMIKKPEVANRIIGLARDHVLDVVHHWVDTFGAEHVIPHIWEPLATNQIISPHLFEKFVLPYQKELHEGILSMGVKHLLCHICGEQNSNLQYWAEIPMGDPGIVSIGHEVDLLEAIKYFGEKSIIAGNIDPAVLLNGTPQQVYELTRQCIQKAKHSPRGYMMMTGCEVPPTAPPYNLNVMMRAVNDFGWYDR